MYTLSKYLKLLAKLKSDQSLGILGSRKRLRQRTDAFYATARGRAILRQPRVAMGRAQRWRTVLVI